MPRLSCKNVDLGKGQEGTGPRGRSTHCRNGSPSSVQDAPELQGIWKEVMLPEMMLVTAPEEAYVECSSLLRAHIPPSRIQRRLITLEVPEVLPATFLAAAVLDSRNTDGLGIERASTISPGAMKSCMFPRPIQCHLLENEVLVSPSRVSIVVPSHIHPPAPQIRNLPWAPCKDRRGVVGGEHSDLGGRPPSLHLALSPTSRSPWVSPSTPRAQVFLRVVGESGSQLENLGNSTASSRHKD